MERVNRSKSMPVVDSTRLATPLMVESKTSPDSALAISCFGACNSPPGCLRALRWLQVHRNCPVFVAKVTSAKHSPVWRDMISLPLWVTLFSRGVRPYRARQTASRMVVLPAPVGPVMAKMPSEV